MIHIRRQASTAPALIKRTAKPRGSPPTTRAERETNAAIAYFSSGAGGIKQKPQSVKKKAANKSAITAVAPKAFKFSVYKDKEIASQLRLMFFHKCAYCESQYRHVSSTDIEHFRPKGAILINDTLQGPGYYWLAATWENLFPSCPLCNRTGNYELVGATTTEAGGKGCAFPLLDELKRVRKHDLSIDEEEKQRLLLNPCVDNPEDVLHYLGDGTMVAKPGLSVLKRRRASESIRIYGLFRGELVARRHEKMIELAARLDAVDDASLFLSWMIKDGVAKTRIKKQARRLEEEVAALKMMFDAKSPYQGLLRFQIRQQLGGKLATKLKRRGINIGDLLPP